MEKPNQFEFDRWTSIQYTRSLAAALSKIHIFLLVDFLLIFCFVRFGPFFPIANPSIFRVSFFLLLLCIYIYQHNRIEAFETLIYILKRGEKVEEKKRNACKKITKKIEKIEYLWYLVIQRSVECVWNGWYIIQYIYVHSAHIHTDCMKYIYSWNGKKADSIWIENICFAILFLMVMFSLFL